MTTNTTPLSGLGLRYVLANELQNSRRPLSVSELADRLQRRGFTFAGRPSKAISDSLRTEVRKGRAQRISRGVYMFVTASRSMARRFRAMATHCHEYVVAQTRADITPWDNHHWVWRI
jgi:hypothetical protein